MAFNSLNFLLFLSLVIIAFHSVGCRYQWIVLLLSSYAFYAFLKKFDLLLVLSSVTLLTYCFGRALDGCQDGTRRTRIFIAGICSNLLILVYYKYLPFIAENINSLLGAMQSDRVLPVPPLQVSIALSFFIFTALSYLADIYFRIARSEHHLGYFALYISFFPKLLQGPIERAEHFLMQLREPSRFNPDTFRNGLLLFAWGLFQKVVVADRLGMFVDPVYNNAHSYSGLSLVVATYCYAFQLYYDFSGYTTMALGIAGLFNIGLTQNFNRPYLATSIADFWRRWHISFSKLILDYIFEPLQMRLRQWGLRGTVIALLVTFLVVGIWHGASWGYVVFGGLQGLYMTTGLFWRPYQKKVHKFLGVQKTMLLRVWQTAFVFHLTCFAFIFFRASSLADALYIARQALVGLPADILEIATMGAVAPHLLSPVESPGSLLFALLLVALVAACSAVDRSHAAGQSAVGGFAWLSRTSLIVRSSVIAIFFYLFAFHNVGVSSFIYMQF